MMSSLVVEDVQSEQKKLAKTEKKDYYNSISLSLSLLKMIRGHISFSWCNSPLKNYILQYILYCNFLRLASNFKQVVWDMMIGSVTHTSTREWPSCKLFTLIGHLHYIDLKDPLKNLMVRYMTFLFCIIRDIDIFIDLS